MRALAYFVIPTGKLLVSPDSSSTFSFGRVPIDQDIEMPLRFLDLVDGNLVEVQRGVRYFRATIPALGDGPASGTFRFKIGNGVATAGNQSAAVDWRIDQEAVKSALNAIADKQGVFTVRTVPKGLEIRCGDGLQVVWALTENTLDPYSLGYFRGWQDDAGKWTYEFRLRQAPLAFTDECSRVDPPEPTTMVLAEGYADGSGSYFTNTVQKLSIPREFRAGYFLRDPRNNRLTRLLTKRDNAAAIQVALSEILAVGEEVTVEDATTTGPLEAKITFAGTLKGVNVELFLVEIAPDAPPGDVEFRLSLKAPPMFAALRGADKGELVGRPLEITIDILPTPEDEQDPDAAAVRCKSSGVVLTLASPADWDALATAGGYRLLRGASSPGYKPSNPSMVGVGQLFYEEILGDGATTDFVIDHSLGSQSLTGFVVVDRTTGQIRREGYEVFELTVDSFRIEFDDAPSVADEESGGVKVLVATPQSLEVFLADFHIAIGNVDGLEERLSTIEGHILALQAVLPTAGVGATSTGTHAYWQIKNYAALIPRSNETRVKNLLAALVIPNASEDGTVNVPVPKLADLPPSGYLLPAVHDAVLGGQSAVDALPSAAANLNQALAMDGGPLLLPGDGGIPETNANDSEIIISDGRMWTLGENIAGTKSYYPKAFNFDLLNLGINDRQLRVGATFTLEFYLATQLFRANTNTQYFVEIATCAYGESTGGTPAFGPNLSDVTWETNGRVGLRYRIYLGPSMTTHRFGLRIKRNASEILSDKLLYTEWEAADAVPSAANVALRARLCRHDTENRIDPRGLAYLAIFGVKAAINK